MSFVGVHRMVTSSRTIYIDGNIHLARRVNRGRDPALFRKAVADHVCFHDLHIRYADRFLHVELLRPLYHFLEDLRDVLNLYVVGMVQDQP